MVRASGLEYLALATELLQRARLADAAAGLWEAADLQWCPTVPLPTVWACAVKAIDALELETVDVLVRDDDLELPSLLAGAGFAPTDDRSGITRRS